MLLLELVCHSYTFTKGLAVCEHGTQDTLSVNLG